jgi:hypothetical protein
LKHCGIGEGFQEVIVRIHCHFFPVFGFHNLAFDEDNLGEADGISLLGAGVLTE